MPRSRASAQKSDAAATDGRRRRGDQSRATILSRAVNVASTQGLGGLTIGALAADVGISKGNISILFGDKEALQLATLDAAIGTFAANVVAPALRLQNRLERLRHLIDGWFDHVDSRRFPGGCMLHAASSEYRARPGRIRDRVIQHRNAWFRLIVRTIREGQHAGQIRNEVDGEQLAFELNAFQAAANAAALLGDQAGFVRARRTCRARLAAAAPAAASHPVGNRSRPR